METNKILKHSINTEAHCYSWQSNIERLDIIQKGLSYKVIPEVCLRANMTVNQILERLDISQSTYYRKLKDGSNLTKRQSELIVLMVEVVDFGISVFNNENDKFLRWLEKRNYSLGGEAPISFFDTWTGIGVVRDALYRIEYGNLA